MGVEASYRRINSGEWDQLRRGSVVMTNRSDGKLIIF